MALFEKCIEPLAALGCGLAAVMVGQLDTGVAVGGAVGVAGILARFRENCARHGLDEPELIRRTQIAVLRRWDRHDTTQAERDAITDADMAMALHLPDCMLDRAALAATSVATSEPYPKRASRLIADALAQRDDMFAAGPFGEDEPLARHFAREAIECALSLACEDQSYATLLTVDLLLAGNQAHAITHEKLDAILAKFHAQTSVPKETVIAIAYRVVGSVSDFEDAVATIQAAIDELIALRAKAARGSNLGDLLDNALSTIAERNDRNDFEAAALAGEHAWAKLIEEAERLNAAKIALVDAMIQQSRVRINAAELARWTIERLLIEHGELSAPQLLVEVQRFLSATEAQALPLESNAALILVERAVEIARGNLELCAANNLLGDVARKVGERTGGKEGLALLSRAESAFQAALKVIPEGMTEDWATVQNNLGNALVTHSERRIGTMEEITLTTRAMSAFDAALTVFTRQANPFMWARTTDSLLIMTRGLGERTAGQEGLAILATTVSAYDEVLKVVSRKKSPFIWANIQNNFANALAAYGLRIGGQSGLKQLARAIKAHNAALKIYTLNKNPMRRAKIRHSMGSVRETMADYTVGPTSRAHLSMAESAYARALTVFASCEAGYYHDMSAAALARVRAKIAKSM